MTRILKSGLAASLLAAAFCGPRPQPKRCCGKSPDCCVTSRAPAPVAMQAAPIAARPPALVADSRSESPLPRLAGLSEASGFAFDARERGPPRA